MFTLKFGSNTDRRTNPAVDLNTTIKSFMTANGMDVSKGVLMLDGTQISGVDVNKTFAECGFKTGETHSLYVTVKADGAQI